MSTHVRCPQCGGDQVQINRVSVDARPTRGGGQPPSGSDWGSGWVGWSPSGSDWDAFAAVVVFLVGLVALVVLLVRYLGRRSRAATVSSYSCLLCGFQWHPGQVFSAGAAPPALIPPGDPPLQEAAMVSAEDLRTPRTPDQPKRAFMRKHTVIWLSALSLSLSLLGILLFFGGGFLLASTDARTAEGGGFLVLLGMLCFLTAVGIGLVPWITGLSRAAKRHTWGWLVVVLCLGSLGTLLYGVHLLSQDPRSAGGMYSPPASLLR